MIMMFPRISYLIGEQRLIHNVSDLYMYLQQPQCLSSLKTSNNDVGRYRRPHQYYTYTVGEGLLKPAAGGFFLGIVGQFCRKDVPKTYNIRLFFCVKEYSNHKNRLRRVQILINQ